MRIFLIAIFLSFLPLQAMADEECYSTLEAEAEQGIRIHSELMVIGLNCQHMGKRYDKDLYGQYREITARHADLFEMYEDALIKFYARQGKEKPEASLNTLRTGFANKISTDAAEMRPDIFCGRYAARIEKAHEMERDHIRSWAGTIYDTHPVSFPICGHDPSNDTGEEMDENVKDGA